MDFVSTYTHHLPQSMETGSTRFSTHFALHFRDTCSNQDTGYLTSFPLTHRIDVLIIPFETKLMTPLYQATVTFLYILQAMDDKVG